MNISSLVVQLKSAFGFVTSKKDPVTGRITKYANGIMIETTVTVTEHADLVSAGTIVTGCIYNVIPDA